MTQQEWPRAVYQEVLYGVQEVLTYMTGFEPQDTSAETSLRGDLGLDMVDILRVLKACEARFVVKVPNGILGQLHTVDDIVRCVLDQQNTEVAQQ